MHALSTDKVTHESIVCALHKEIMPGTTIMQAYPRHPFLVSKRMTFIKSNDWYYKPNSAPTAPVGGSCNRAILHAKGRRTSGPAPIVVFGAGPVTKHIPSGVRIVSTYGRRGQ